MAEFKFSCPQCGQNIQCGTGYSGTQINCPVCQQAIAVPPAPPSAVPPAMPVSPQAAQSSAIRRGTPVLAATQTPVRAKSRTLRNALIIAATVVVLAVLVIGGWYGYSKIRIYVKYGHLPSGVVALWSGDGNGKDSIDGNNATLTDITFAKGKVGQAFRFNGKSSSIKIPASQSLDVGAGDGFTIMAWIKLADISQYHPIFEWNEDGNAYGVQLYVYPAGQLVPNVVDNEGKWHIFKTDVNVVTANVFQYVALTYEKASGLAMVYCNGVVVAQDHLGIIVPQTSYNLYLGRRPVRNGPTYTFAGMLDEPTVYKRALSAAEIQAIYERQK